MTDTTISMLTCPECRYDVDLPELEALPDRTYHCLECGEDWSDTRFWTVDDYKMAILACAWLFFQIGVMAALILGWILVLRDNYGYSPPTHDSFGAATGYGTLYGFLTFLFWILFLFPALMDSLAAIGRQVTRLMWRIHS